MWKFLFGLLFVATPIFAQENPSAYEALRVIGTQLNRQVVNRVISVNGIDGDPQPRTWKILVEAKVIMAPEATVVEISKRPCRRKRSRSARAARILTIASLLGLAIRLAIRHEAELIPCSIIEDGPWRFRIEIDEATPREFLRSESDLERGAAP